MAYIGKEAHDPVWLPESLPEEILAESFIETFKHRGGWRKRLGAGRAQLRLYRARLVRALSAEPAYPVPPRPLLTRRVFNKFQRGSRPRA